MLVLRQPSALSGQDRIVEAGDQRRGRIPGLEGGRIDERLECGTGLPLRLRGAVEPALVEVASADHDPHVPGGRIHGDERTLKVVGRILLGGFLAGCAGSRRKRAASLGVLEPGPLLDVLQPLLDERFGGSLQIAVDRRVDAEAALIDPLEPEPLHQLAADLLLEVETERLPDLERVVHLDGRRLRARCGRRIDRAEIDHRLEDDVAPRDCAIEVDRRRIGRWTLNQPGQQRRFGHLQIRGRLAEIAPRGGLYAVQAVAEIHLVQIHLENLFLGVEILQIGGENRLLQLSPVRLVAVEEREPGQLLRDRARALRAAPLAKIAKRGAADADRINPAVIVEALILDREHRVDQVRRHPVERDFDSLFLEDGEGRTIVRVEDRRRLHHVRRAAQRLPIGQIGGEIVGDVRQPSGREEHRNRHHGHGADDGARSRPERAAEERAGLRAERPDRSVGAGEKRMHIDRTL